MTEDGFEYTDEHVMCAMRMAADDGDAASVCALARLLTGGLS